MRACDSMRCAGGEPPRGLVREARTRTGRIAMSFHPLLTSSSARRFPLPANPPEQPLQVGESLNRPLHVVLVSCGKAKAATPRRASLLYTSALSVLSMRYASAVADELFILSALHGLVAPDTVLTPYGRSLKDMRRHERGDWGLRIAGKLAARYEGLPVRLTFLAGAEYVSWIRRHLPLYWQVREPLAGLGLGRRMQWLSTELQALGSPASSPPGRTASAGS
jgi:hypothetical protein